MTYSKVKEYLINNSTNFRMHTEVAPGRFVGTEADPHDIKRALIVESTDGPFKEGIFADYDESNNTLIIGRCLTDQQPEWAAKKRIIDAALALLGGAGPRFNQSEARSDLVDAIIELKKYV